MLVVAQNSSLHSGVIIVKEQETYTKIPITTTEGLQVDHSTPAVIVIRREVESTSGNEKRWTDRRFA
jgi:hypothetical protein